MGGRGKGCRSRGGEMAQTMYAHMNKQIKTKRKKYRSSLKNINIKTLNKILGNQVQ
jgi:hypothetical protein